MSHCVDCYGTTSVAPCAAVGCISVNYGKCITYSGDDLYCALGGIGTFSFIGTAVAPGTEQIYTIGGTNLVGSGTGATFEVVRTPGSTSYTVTIASRGSEYAEGDQIKILGSALGGVDVTNDLVISVSTLQAVIATGSSLDNIIEIFHNALCSGLSSSGGLDYSALSYSCLRQNGALTGLGSTITTEEQFVESASAALCSLYTDLNAYDTTFDITAFESDMHIPGLESSAPYNLNEALNLMGSAIGAIYTNIDMSGLSLTCSAYTFTTAPSTDTVVDYIEWLGTNMCNMYDTLSTSVSDVTSDTSSISSYISGVSSTPASVDTSSITGGSSGSTLHTAVNTIVSNVATLNTSVASIPASTYAVTWATCFGGSYPTNSTFKGQTWNYTNTAASIQTQFDRIASVLSQLNTKFDAAYFTVTAGSCGPTISLNSSVAFSASSLNTISIDAMQDVNTGSATSGDFLVYDTSSSNEWLPKEFDITINGLSTDVARTETTSAVTYDLTIANSSPVVTPFVGYSVTEYNVTGNSRFPTSGQPFPYATIVNDVATINGIFQINVVGSFSWAHLADKTLATVPSNLQPTTPAHFNVNIYVKGSGTYSVVHGTVTINGANMTVNLMSPGGSLTLTSGDLIEIAVSGCSYHLD